MDIDPFQQVRQWLLPKVLNPVFALTSDGHHLAHMARRGQVNVYHLSLIHI
jgi:hypothetical protein